jgi:hypothetical protein
MDAGTTGTLLCDQLGFHLMNAGKWRMNTQQERHEWNDCNAQQ